LNSDSKISPEQAYYEDDQIWNKALDSDPDEADRFRRIAKTIPTDTKSLLDVGCGNGDFLRSVEGCYERTCGVDRSAAALKYVKTEKYRASAENIPFEDREFDTVCCLEVIEHLPVNLYVAVLSELVRVADRHVIISVPFDENTRADLVTCPSCHCSFNRSYHLRSFDRKKISQLFDGIDGDFAVRSIDTVGVAAHPIGLTQLKRFVAPLRKERLPSGAVCPQCAYSPGQGRISGEPRAVAAESTRNADASLLRRILPKHRKPRWIVGLYSRRV
jgi:SAM-dependent methyltransferase